MKFKTANFWNTVYFSDELKLYSSKSGHHWVRKKDYEPSDNR
jgi:hypothetical protein